MSIVLFTKVYCIIWVKVGVIMKKIMLGILFTFIILSLYSENNTKLMVIDNKVEENTSERLRTKPTREAPPCNLTATIINNNDVELNWLPPNSVIPDEITEGFEWTFPPAAWITESTNTTHTWEQFEIVTFTSGDVIPTEGLYQAGVRWNYNHQDEWLITSEISNIDSLTFDYFGSTGSNHGDNYYVKVSTDGGENWTPVWNASDLPEGANNYDTPIQIDLSVYASDTIKVAWNFVDGDGEGLWWSTFIDNIIFSNNGRALTFDTSELKSFSKAKPVASTNSVSKERLAKDPNYISALVTRELTGYKIYRDGDEISTITSDMLTYTDENLDVANYEYCVTALYTASESGPSNTVEVSIYNSIDAPPPSNFAGEVVNSNVNLSWEVPIISSESMHVRTIMDRDLTSYKIYRNAVNIAEVDSNTLNYLDIDLENGSYIYQITAVYGDVESIFSNIVTLYVDNTDPDLVYEFTESFESYSDFALSAEPWVFTDLDNSQTYGLNLYDFPNSASEMAYIVFNPSQTTPPMPNNEAHTGDKYLACFAASQSANNDWLISPLLEVGSFGEVSFWAKSYTLAYGEERFNVNVSNGSTNTNHFTRISPYPYTEVGDEWTQFSYNLDDYIGQDIRIAIRCVSNDAFAFMVDDFKFTTSSDIEEFSTITGQLVSQFDENVGIEGEVTIQGYTNLEVDTDLNGNFTIENLPLNHYYTLTANALGFEAYTTDFTTTNQNIDLGTITLFELLEPPTQVIAELNEDIVNVSWLAPADNRIGNSSPVYKKSKVVSEIGNVRSLIGFNIYRFLASELDNEELWNQLNDEIVTESYYADQNVSTLYGNYKYAVKSIYSGNGISDAAFSEEVIIINDAIAPPENLTALVTNQDVTLSWQAPNSNTSHNATNFLSKNSAIHSRHNKESRNVLRYKIYRDNSEIATLTSNILSFIDLDLDYATYEYYVTAVYTETESIPSNSVIVEVDEPEAILPPTDLNVTIIDDDVSLSWSSPNRLISRDLTNYIVYRNDEQIALVEANILFYTDLDLDNGIYSYHVTAMYGETESESSNSIMVMIDNDYLIDDSFETYPDFSTGAYPWVLIDGDLSPTYVVSEVSFENSGDPMAYIVFNPSMTTPPLDAPEYQAFDGDKYIASFAASIPPNNDWLISQNIEITYNPSLKFWVKSLTADYGLERFKVLVSPGSTHPNDFISISGENYIEAPTEWTQFTYDLSDFEVQNIRVAIQCVSNDAFVLMLDQFQVSSAIIPHNDDPSVSNINTALISNYPNPFNPETTISYFIEKTGNVTLEVYNILGQKVKTLVNERINSGRHDVVWNGRDDKGRSVASGIYFYRMQNGTYSKMNKMILLK